MYKQEDQMVLELTSGVVQHTLSRILETFGKKREIAEVTAQLQAQVKVANLSRKHKSGMSK